jgi:acetyl esterase/lipase
MQNSSRHLIPVYETGLAEDIVYAQPGSANAAPKALRLDIYHPINALAALRPAILWFHGGGFRPGNDKRQVYIPRFARAFAARGMVGIAPDYRVRPDPSLNPAAALLDAVSDGKQALAWVIANAAEYRIDPQRIVLAGGSAGGMLVLNLVHTSPGPLAGLIGVIDLWGTPDGKWRGYDHINPGSPATLIVHGTADALVPYQNSLDFAAELQQAGISNKLITLPDAPHTPMSYMDQIIESITSFLEEIIQ